MNNNLIVYVLEHTYYYGLNKAFIESKMIGVYSSKEKVNEAKEFYYPIEGFNKHPRECFICTELEVDVNSLWLTGFEERRDLLEKEYEYEDSYYAEEDGDEDDDNE